MALTASEITTQLETTFASRRPISGYIVNLFESGAVTARATLTKTNPGGVDGTSTANVSFTISDETWYAMITPAGSASSGGGGVTDYPFKIVNASTLAGTPEAKAKVLFGHISNYIPTMDGTSLAAAPEHTFSAAGTYFGYLDFDGSSVVVTWTTGTIPDDSSTNTYCLIGAVVVVVSGAGYAISGSPLQGINSSFKVRYCSDAVWFWTALRAA